MNQSESRDIPIECGGSPGSCGYRVLTAPAAKAASTVATTACPAWLSGTEAILAVDRTIAPRFERNRRLLSAAGTDHARTIGFAARVPAAPTAAARFLLLGLAAWLAALRR